MRDHAHFPSSSPWSAVRSGPGFNGSPSGLALAAKLLLQTITKELTLQCATRRGFREICSLTLGACARVTVLALSFGRSVCLSLLLQRSAIASTRQLRYEQAKHDHGLQCDSWIMLKCFRSRVMAGSPGRPSWTFLTTKAHMVDNLGTCRLHLNIRTALRVRRNLNKSPATGIATRPQNTL